MKTWGKSKQKGKYATISTLDSDDDFIDGEDGALNDVQDELVKQERAKTARVKRILSCLLVLFLMYVAFQIGTRYQLPAPTPPPTTGSGETPPEVNEVGTEDITLEHNGYTYFGGGLCTESTSGTAIVSNDFKKTPSEVVSGVLHAPSCDLLCKLTSTCMGYILRRKDGISECAFISEDDAPEGVATAAEAKEGYYCWGKSSSERTKGVSFNRYNGQCGSSSLTFSWRQKVAVMEDGQALYCARMCLNDDSCLGYMSRGNECAIMSKKIFPQGIETVTEKADINCWVKSSSPEPRYVTEGENVDEDSAEEDLDEPSSVSFETKPPVPTEAPVRAPSEPPHPTEAPSISPRALPLEERLTLLKEAIEEMREMLVDYYTLERHHKYGKQEHPAEEILNAAFGSYKWKEDEKMAEKFPNATGWWENGINALKERFIRFFVHRRTFKVGTIGSSVTAGHDNCHHDCYQEQLNRLLQPVFEKGGYRFVTLNAGMTGACGNNYMNHPWCLRTHVGMDVDITHYSWTYFEHSELQRYHERFIRWSFYMKRRALPMILYTGGCKMKGEFEKNWERYADLGYDFLCMEEPANAAHHQYIRIKRAVGDLMHNTTREGENENTRRMRSLGVGFRNWHPGPLMFQTTADALAWKYSHAMLRAIDEILKEKNPLKKWPEEIVPMPEIGSPIKCKQCDKGVPYCYDGEWPIYGEQTIQHIPYDSPEYPKRFKSEPSHWQRYHAPYTKIIPWEEKHLPYCTHTDACGGFNWPESIKQHDPPTDWVGWLVFKLPKLEQGYVAFCSNGKMLNEGEYRVVFNDKELKRSDLQKIDNKCLLVQHVWMDKHMKDLEFSFLAINQNVTGKNERVDHIYGL